MNALYKVRYKNGDVIDDKNVALYHFCLLDLSCLKVTF